MDRQPVFDLGRLLDRLESRISLALMFASSSIVGILTSYLASLSTWIEQFGAFAWVLAGLFGTILTLTAFLLALIISQQLRRRWAMREWVLRADELNPLDDHFLRKRIRLDSLIDPLTNAIEGKTFTDCQVDGPAAIILRGTGLLNDVNFAQCDLVVLRDGECYIYNAVPVVNCTFVRCRLSRFILLMRMNEIQPLLDMGAEPITNVPSKSG